ncbi:MAG: hypothetical protein KatS3mg068_1233 [Candidatus Sericytochromatia bacterium]|nr:MAG: hypothetical protein KatS3mg068_1233 [Candidatus Sericytochromatia bacterium]
MKKLLIFLTSFIFSCQSSNIIVKPYKEVNNLNKEYVLDLGYKGPSIKINLNFNKSNPFVIKNIDDSFNGISSVSRIEIRLSSSQGTSLADRFGNNCPCPPNTRNGVAYIDLINPALNNSITVKGLKPSTDYYISARAYASLRVNGSTQEINVTSSDGTPSDTLGGGTSGAFGNFGINEEYISVDNNGVLTINNDDNDNNVANGLNPNHDWDISIQLMKSKGARINNNEINIQDGSTSTTTNSNLVYSSYTNNKIANRYMLYNQRNPSVAIADNGRYMIAWEGQGSGDNDGIFARLYDEKRK